PGSPIRNLSEDNAEKGLPTALYPKTKAIAEKIVLAYNSSSMTTISLPTSYLGAQQSSPQRNGGFS
ncbi:MAG: hypothetical protein AB8B56_21260, partial [Crocinitomicaceae bacterium]